MSFSRSFEVPKSMRLTSELDPLAGWICSIENLSDRLPGPTDTAAAASGGGERTSRALLRTYVTLSVVDRKLCAQLGAPVKASAWKRLALEPATLHPTVSGVGVSELQTTQLLTSVAPVAVFSSTVPYLKIHPDPSRVATGEPPTVLVVAVVAVTSA